MSSLFVLGNINQYTFANSIVAANSQAVRLFNRQLDNIFVLHSVDSQNKLHSNSEWRIHLQNHGIQQDLFVERIVEINNTEESIQRFVEYIEMIIKGLSDSFNVMVDVTNGTSFQKTFLSTAAYILNINHQYVIDITKLFSLTEDRKFIAEDILISSYIAMPNTQQLDSIAYLNFSEMIRYRNLVEKYTKKFQGINKSSADTTFFRDNLMHSIRIKQEGDNTQDHSLHRIAASSMAVSIEEMIGLLVKDFITIGDPERSNMLTLGEKMKAVFSHIEKQSPENFDIELFRKLNDFMLYIRNSTTHKGKPLSNVERLKANLSISMVFPFIEFYTDVVHPILSHHPSIWNRTIMKLTDRDIVTSSILYFGLDGDNTGDILEKLFLSADENELSKLSNSISKAIMRISEQIRKDVSNNGVIIFQAGDDILFKGAFDRNTIKGFQNTYRNITSGQSCSIGFGKSLQEVYFALKLAKNQPGKNAVVGVKLS